MKDQLKNIPINDCIPASLMQEAIKLKSKGSTMKQEKEINFWSIFLRSQGPNLSVEMKKYKRWTIISNKEVSKDEENKKVKAKQDSVQHQSSRMVKQKEVTYAWRSTYERCQQTYGK